MNKNIEKAIKNLSASQKDIEDGFYDSAISRAYYAMFYCAEAVLLLKGLRFSKHSGVHAAFGEYFAKTGEIDAQLHRLLLDAYDKRAKGDYRHMIEITKEDAEKVIKDAEYFITEIKKKLEQYLTE